MYSANILKKFGSGEYQVKLSETLTSIIKGISVAETEATVASVFENNLYYFIKQFLGKEIIFHKESGKNYFRHQFNGRIDAISNGLVIEYKSIKKLNNKKEQDESISQIKDYLIQIYNETSVGFQGVITNGKKISYLYLVNGEVKNTSFSTLESKDIDRIVQTLLNVGSKKFEPKNIVSDFKINSPLGITNQLIKSLYNAIFTHKTQKTEMLMEEWQVLFRLSEQDKGQNDDIRKRRIKLSEIFNDNIDNNEKEYQALYVLQTSYAIIVKLIACKVIQKLSFSEDIKFFSDLSKINSNALQIFMDKLEDGYVFSSGGIRNLLEGDFYSWYCDKNQWDINIYKSIKSIIKELEFYSSSNFNYEFQTIDIFKDLYMEIMPNEIRHSLGEYYTPSWMADQIVKRSLSKLNKKNWRAIDPCCGSGVFLISLIKSILEKHELYSLTIKEKQELLSKVLSSVFGIDLNPLSVLTSRVSYFLAIRPLIVDQKIELPVYLGDSADIPQKIKIDNIDCYTYKVETRQGDFDIKLPCEFVESNSFFERMYRLQTIIEAEDPELLYQQIVEHINESSLNDKIMQEIMKLSIKLTELHRNEWDGIWVRITSNFMLIARIKEIDLILGNPPWVKWEFLPQNYALKIKELCIDKKLFSGQSYMGAISLNLCALIANVTADNWLTNDGILAFLMPKTIMTQDSYAGFRNFHLKNSSRMYLTEIDDWSNSGNPFIVTTEKFMTYFYEKKFTDYSTGVPINFYHKKLKMKINEINRFHDFDKVKDFFELKEGMAYQLSENRTGFTMLPERDFSSLSKLKIISGQSDYKARSGVEFTPAEVYFVEPEGKANNNFWFRNSEFKNSIYKNDKKYKFELETRYIKPVIKSPFIRPFEILKSNNYCIFPYEENNKNSVPLKELVKNSELLSSYLIKNRKLIQKQSKRSLMISMGDDFYSLSKVGEYTFSPYKVVFRDNTNMCASVVLPLETPWGKQLPIPAKHSPYISMDKKGVLISEDEAYYICGILNTEIVNKYFKYTFSGRSYSINFEIKLPKFNPKNMLQLEISKLARELTLDKDGYDRKISKIEQIYLTLCSDKSM